MQLKNWLLVALAAVTVQEASPFILTAAALAGAGAAAAGAGAAAAAATALAFGLAAKVPVLEVVGGTAVLLGTAGLVGKATIGKAALIGAAASPTVVVTTVPVATVRKTVVTVPVATVQKTISYRRTREATSVVEDDASTNTLDILFSAAGTLDSKTNCGLRVVCELAATPVQHLAPDEALLMSLFGEQTSLVPDQINSPVLPFQLAAFLGNQSGSAAACANTYHKCHYNSTQIMDMIRQSDPHQL